MKKILNIFVIMSLIITTLFSTNIIKANSNIKNWLPYIQYSGPTTFEQDKAYTVNFRLYEGEAKTIHYEFAVYDMENEKILHNISNTFYCSGNYDYFPIETKWYTYDLEPKTYYFIGITYTYDYDKKDWTLVEDNIVVYPVQLEANKSAKDIVFPNNPQVVNVNEDYKVQYTVLPENAPDKSVTFTSSEPSVATIDQNGVVHAISAGTTKIRVTASNGVYRELTLYVHDTQFPFYDVSPKMWYRNIIQIAYQKGLIKGTSENFFSPDGQMTRGMVATILYRMANAPDVKFEKKFKDVDDGLFYSKAITWASNAKVVNGYDNGNFGPDDPITREQMAVMIANFAIYTGVIKYLDQNVQDLSNNYTYVSDYALPAMHWCYTNKIIQGNIYGHILPQNTATRAECTKMLSLLDDIIKNNNQ